jgi:hypothetical protein
MIARIFSVLTLVCKLPSISIRGEAITKSPRRDPMVIQVPKQEAWLTQEQADHVLAAIELIVQEMQQMSKQNKAPRTDVPGVCDPSFPGCGLVDLSGIMAELCLILNQVSCICKNTVSIIDLNLSIIDITTSISDILGSCNDHSVLLGSQVDKSCIDSLCLSVISLLKTILLELRGGFTGPFPCTVTP